jgi:hypothetical protein
MTLKRLFCQPCRFFATLENFSFVLPLVALCALSLLSEIIVLSRPGLAVVVRDVQGLHPPGGDGLALVLLVILLKPILVLVDVLLWGALLNLCLYLTMGVSSFREVFTICCYAAYAREAVRFILTAAAGAYAKLTHLHVSIITDATAFLSKAATSKSLYYLAGCLDAPRLWFIILVTIGLWKTVAGLPLRKAAMIVATPAVIFVGLGFWALH